MNTPEDATPQAAPEQLEVPDDANDLRGFHFKRLLRKPLTWILIAVFMVAIGGVLAAAIGPAIGGGGAVAAFVVGIIAVFALADSKAADAFFEVYAQQRGMSQVHGRGKLPPATPLLRKGDDRYTERTLLGPLAGGPEGTLALYTYEEESTDSNGDRQTNYYHYTVGLLEIPECAAHVPELYCQRKFGLRALEKFEDVFRRSKERVKLESEVLDEKYEIFAGGSQDEVWLRRLFAPTFIVWLTDSAPKKFAFELVNGTLCCYVNGHKENAEDLDAIAVATATVGKRLQDESVETS